MSLADISPYFPLAIRLVLDSVSYSNALPDWFETLTIDYFKREQAVHERARRYLSGEQPKRPFEIAVPKRSGGDNSWVIPSTNDQIVLQTCISVIAQDLQQKCIDTDRVFSCLCNTDPNRLAFLEDQVEAWTRFQLETQKRCTSQDCILQFDIATAYQAMGSAHVGAFLRTFSLDGTALELLEILLAAFTYGSSGLPFLNDSVFFLGNAYLSEVDRVVNRRTENFVRFVDDYRVFGGSRDSLENIFEAIRTDLREELGFEINEAKIRLGTTEEYLDALSKAKYAEMPASHYIDTAVVPDVYSPENVYEMVERSVRSPEEYLHQGFGRLQMASIRRMRVQSLFAKATSDDRITPRSAFISILSKDVQLIRRISELLKQCSSDSQELWRLLWLLFLAKDVAMDEIPDKMVSAELGESLQKVNGAIALPMVARLWASPMPDYPESGRSAADVEELHALDYLERGRQCYGGR